MTILEILSNNSQLVFAKYLLEPEENCIVVIITLR